MQKAVTVRLCWTNRRPNGTIGPDDESSPSSLTIYDEVAWVLAIIYALLRGTIPPQWVRRAKRDENEPDTVTSGAGFFIPQCL
jgi:hypothetical protein